MNNKKLYAVILAMATPCSLKRIHEFKKKPKFHTGSIWGSEISKPKVRWKISQNYEALISKVSQSYQDWFKACYFHPHLHSARHQIRILMISMGEGKTGADTEYEQHTVGSSTHPAYYLQLLFRCKPTICSWQSFILIPLAKETISWCLRECLKIACQIQSPRYLKVLSSRTQEKSLFYCGGCPFEHVSRN